MCGEDGTREGGDARTGRVLAGGNLRLFQPVGEFRRLVQGCTIYRCRALYNSIKSKLWSPPYIFVSATSIASALASRCWL